jgi:hypothetical protein
MRSEVILPENSASPAERQRSATSLLRAIIVKAGLEILLVCVAVSLAAFSHVNPPLRGAIDVADSARVAGWAYDPREPGARLEVQLFIDGRFVASRVADERRDDLVKRGAAEDALHGFTFAVPPLGVAPGRHTYQVFAVRAGGGGNKVLLSITREPQVFHVGSR